jgi:hypothetical protein
MDPDMRSGSVLQPGCRGAVPVTRITSVAQKHGAADDDLTVQLTRVDPRKMLLVGRGFHWINEVPFNR